MNADPIPCTTPILSFDRVSKSFPVKQGLFQPPAQLHALNDVSFDLHAGQIMGIVGESGSGKSTLGRLAMGMLPPSSGTIRYQGQAMGSLRGQDLRQVRRDMQMVFQDPSASLNGRMRIEQCLREPFLLHKEGTHATQNAAIARLLDVVGLPSTVLGRYPHELSGGQKQRVVIARALALQPKLIVADEAVAALDVSVKAQIVNLLLDLRTSLGLSILFVSHDLPIVQSVCDKVLVLYLGHVMELASASTLRHGAAHPYTKALMRSSPMADPARTLRQEDLLAGEIPSPLAPPSGCVFHTRCPWVMPECSVTPPRRMALDGDSEVACLYYARESGA